VAVELSYCVINTNGGEFLAKCLGSVRRTHPEGVEHEVIVVDNASDDGSAEMVRSRFPEVRLVANDRREGITTNLNLLLREARGRFFCFLNEDVELLEGAPGALLEALRADARAAAAGAMLLDPEHRETACAWRLPGLGPAAASALFLHRWLVNESGGPRTREVGWCRSAALMIRHRAAEEVDGFDTGYFFYSEDADFQKRLRDRGWRILHVPAARVVHDEQASSRGQVNPRRLVQFHRSRDRYMRKHHSALAAKLAGILWAWSYVPRAVAALFLPGHKARSYWVHARQALWPRRGEGMREAAEAYNLALARAEVEPSAAANRPSAPAAPA
jgi:N-acetylglucosaminyl-diphospho-decaprenol L-rhamnosyltransferase